MLTRVYRQANRALRVHGVLGSAKIVWEKARHKHEWRSIPSEYDRQHGVVTDGNEDLAGHYLRVRYQPTAEPIVREMIATQPLCREAIFIDVGSGKGRVVLVASEYPFGRIMGVEYARELNDVAVANLDAYKSPTQQCRNIGLFCTDATTFPLPPEPTVLFLANPFRGSIMTAFIKNVEESLRLHPRPFYVLYRQAKEAAQWDASRSFIRMAETPMYTTWRAR